MSVNSGAMIDYYLKKATGSTVTIEIVDSGGVVVQTFSSDPNAQRPPAARGAARSLPESPESRRSGNQDQSRSPRTPGCIESRGIR